MKIIICVILVFTGFRAVTQIQTTLDSLELQLRQNYDSIEVANVEEYKSSSKLIWLKLMPSLGYNLIQNTPVVSFSLSDLSSYIEAKHSRQQKIISIEKKNKIDLNSAVFKLRSGYEHINSLIQKYSLDKQIYEAKSELFEIYSKKYENDEIKLETFLQYKIDFLNSQKNLQDKEELILSKIYELKSVLSIDFVYKL